MVKYQNFAILYYFSYIKQMKSYSHYSWIGVVVFFVVTAIGQAFTTHYFTQGYLLIDIFQLIVAPAGCFAIASLFGIYKNSLSTLVSAPGVLVVSLLFYALFQKITFFKDSDLVSIIMTNMKLMGIPFCSEIVLALVLSCVLTRKKCLKI